MYLDCFFFFIKMWKLYELVKGVRGKKNESRNIVRCIVLWKNIYGMIVIFRIKVKLRWNLEMLDCWRWWSMIFEYIWDDERNYRMRR